MAISEAQKRAVAKFDKKAYDKVIFRVEKGKRQEIKEFAIEHGTTLNKFINDAIDEKINRDKQ